jgi:TonB family protein
MRIRKRIAKIRLTDSVMLKAIIVSIIVHFGVVCLIPSVHVLPPDTQYIEVDRVWIGTGGDIKEDTGSRVQKVVEVQEHPQLDHIPTHLDALESDVMKSSPATADWDTAFVGLEHRLPENLQDSAQVTQPQNYVTRPKSILIEAASEKVFPGEDIAKQVPEPEASISSQAEHDIQPYDDIVLAAEQRAQDEIRPQAIQASDEEISPRFTPLQTPELVESKSERSVSLRRIERTDRRPSPVMSRDEAKFNESDKPNTPFVWLPGTAEHDVQPHDEIVLAAEQRAQDEIRPQAIQASDEEISPRFTPLQTPELVESKSERSVSLRRIERTDRRPSPVMSRDEAKFNESDKPNTPFLRLPETQEFPEQVENKIGVTVDKPISAFTAASPDTVSVSSDKPEELPQTVIPWAVPPSLSADNVEQRKPVIASHPRTLLLPQEIPLSLTPFPQTFETKVTSVVNVHSPEKSPVQSEESIVKIMEPVLPQKIPDQDLSPQSFTEELRSIDVPRNIQEERGSQNRAFPKPFLRPVPAKRSLVLGGEVIDDIMLATRSHFGIFVRKETIPPQAGEPEPNVSFQKNDVIERIATDKEETSSFVIEGPASERHVVYKPAHLPDLQLDMEVEIRLKFWVLPDGTVGEVTPLQRGDARLERAAIQYLKSWRFTPVSQDAPEVWGIIPIKYKFQ